MSYQNIALAPLRIYAASYTEESGSSEGNFLAPTGHCAWDGFRRDQAIRSPAVTHSLMAVLPCPYASAPVAALRERPASLFD